MCRGKGIMLDIAHGLNYLHSTGLVHFDIKVRAKFVLKDYADIALLTSHLGASSQ